MNPPQPDEPVRKRRFGRRRPASAPAESTASTASTAATDGPRVPPPAARPPGVRTAGEIAAEQKPGAEEKKDAAPKKDAPQKDAPKKDAPQKDAATSASPALPKATTKPPKTSAPKTSVAHTLRTRLAAVLWAVAVICALVLAVAALLVALRANQDNAAVAAVLDAADVLDLGIFGRENGVFTFTGADAEVRSALVNWGLGAVAYLVLGKLLDRIIRP